MILLLVKNSKTSYTLFSPDTYGMKTWGTNHQESIVKNKKSWYKTYWTAGNDYVDDSLYEDKINVVLETNNIDDVLAYLNIKNLNQYATTILEEYKNIVDDYVSFTKWFLRGN